MDMKFVQLQASCTGRYGDSSLVWKPRVRLSAATDTNRFQPLAQRFPICFVDHRIPFVGPDGDKVSGDTKGSMFVYLPPKNGNVVKHTARFCHLFEQIGTVMVEAGKLVGWALSAAERLSVRESINGWG